MLAVADFSSTARIVAIARQTYIEFVQVSIAAGNVLSALRASTAAVGTSILAYTPLAGQQGMTGG